MAPAPVVAPKGGATPPGTGTGTAEAGAADEAGATAVFAGEGKNVAFWPLKTCQLSHNMTIEKPKITHKMVRRISFMVSV